MVDLAVPNEQWSKDSLELFNKLNDLTTQGTGWTKLKSVSQEAEESRSFLRAVDEKGKFLEYAFFVNSSLQSLKGVVQFGKNTRGRKGIVHGGAAATIFDNAMGSCAQHSGFLGLTVNLNVNYKRPLPIDATVSVEANIDKVEGRKIFTSATMKTVDGEEIYSTATGLFIIPSYEIQI